MKEIKVYLYLIEGLSDWEDGYLLPLLNTPAFYKKDAPSIKVVKVSKDGKPITTAGGILRTADISVEQFKAIKAQESDMLVLIGSNNWFSEDHSAILSYASEWHKSGRTLAAICGATVALATAGILNNVKHTSNDKDFLQQVCPSYTGKDLYQTVTCCADKNLITASGTAPLEFAYEILKRLDIIASKTLDAWYNLYQTHESKYFYELLSSSQ